MFTYCQATSLSKPATYSISMEMRY